MSKLTDEEEKELLVFIKDWLRSLCYTQKDLANELNLKSNRTSEIVKKVKDLYKKGGIFNVAKKLIEIEQNWLNSEANNPQEGNNLKTYNQLDMGSFKNEKQQSNNLNKDLFEDQNLSYNQLDLDSVVNQINKETC